MHFFFFFSSRRRHTRSVSAFLLNRSSDLEEILSFRIHITIIELNALHTKRQNLFQELDAVIHLLMEAKHWGLRKSRNATRSEERRVGKERRSRWSPDDSKKKEIELNKERE